MCPKPHNFGVQSRAARSSVLKHAWASCALNLLEKELGLREPRQPKEGAPTSCEGLLSWVLLTASRQSHLRTPKIQCLAHTMKHCLHHEEVEHSQCCFSLLHCLPRPLVVQILEECKQINHSRLCKQMFSTSGFRLPTWRGWGIMLEQNHEV